MQKNIEKMLLNMAEAVTRSNAKAEGNKTGYCPVIFHQPKRPVAVFDRHETPKH